MRQPNAPTRVAAPHRRYGTKIVIRWQRCANQEQIAVTVMYSPISRVRPAELAIRVVIRIRGGMDEQGQLTRVQAAKRSEVLFPRRTCSFGSVSVPKWFWTPTTRFALQSSRHKTQSNRLNCQKRFSPASARSLMPSTFLQSP